MPEKGGLIVRDDKLLDKPTAGGIGVETKDGKVAFKQGVARVDIVGVYDTTGSMQDKIAGLVATSQKFVDKLGKSNIDWQMAIVGFGDLTVPGDSIVATSFSRKAEVVKQSLQNIPHYSGGGNEGESSLEALQKALGLSGFRPGAIKVFILMTDEPALNSRELNPNIMIDRLRKKGVLTFVISTPIDYWQKMAKTTGGEWFPISASTDFLSILDKLMSKVTETVIEVQKLAGGNVEQYLQLKG